MDWDKENNFINAPLRLLDKIVSKIESQKISGNCNSSRVEGDAVVQQTTKHVNLHTNQTSTSKTVLPACGSSNTRASSKQEVEMVRLESFWSNKLSKRHWNEQFFGLYRHFLAESTLEQYNSYLTRYKTFCIQSYGEFPPQTSFREASITGFLLNVTDVTIVSLGVGAATVSQILRKTLHAAGLAGEYTARGFRAAGATAAIRSGCDPDSTRQKGRWASRDVLFKMCIRGLLQGLTKFS
ncbi:hypothetical protein ElyMa_002665700 [Elysia marginata]|uniref:Uncharacterized protein n=1 Tax=Elysia marginata TaxID=1093978 RepID=A0AAV4HC75_9GAST|nr:hypothetical protein ElyMa_002665700 [Elysia marginata]